MRKILLVILTLTLVFGLGACNGAPNEDYATKSELELLEIEIQAFQEQMDVIQERIDNLTITTGLNGVIDLYENEALKDELELKLVTLSLQMMVVKDTFDKAKDAPDYIKDELGGYISFKDLGIMLKQKYFNDFSVTQYDKFEMGSSANMQFELSGIQDTNDLFAKIVLMIEEIRNYDFYVLSCSELEITLIYDNKIMTVIIPLVVVINSYFEITLNGVYDGDYEMKVKLYQASINEINAQLFYDDYKTNLTYDGFVLNYIN